jgi:hypothetical protein
MEAIEECDSDDASALGVDVRRGSQAEAIAIVGSSDGGRSRSSGEGRSKSSSPAVSKTRSEPTSGSRSREDDVTTLATCAELYHTREMSFATTSNYRKDPFN